MIDKSTKQIGLRLPPELLEPLEQAANEMGVPLATYIKVVLTRHVKERRSGRSSDGGDA